MPASTRKKKASQRIIWAVDPLEDGGVKNQATHVLQDLSSRIQMSIEPVYVLSDSFMGISLPRAELARRYQPALKRIMDGIAKRGAPLRFEAPRVLVKAPSSKGAAADALDHYAQRQGADLILVSSHGRKGLKRAFMGSFAEELVLHSKTPVLISGPKTAATLALNHILFPTDFSEESRKAFNATLPLAKRLGARVTIFNSIPNPVEPIVQSGAALLGGGFVTTRGYVDLIYKEHKQKAQHWIKAARAKGVAADSDFDVGGGISVTKSILAYARKKKPGLIAMSSESSALQAAILGSVGRGVAREAPCPVWFLRAH